MSVHGERRLRLGRPRGEVAGGRACRAACSRRVPGSRPEWARGAWSGEREESVILGRPGRALSHVGCRRELWCLHQRGGSLNTGHVLAEGRPLLAPRCIAVFLRRDYTDEQFLGRGTQVSP